jgi:hypothetical protein
MDPARYDAATQHLRLSAEAYALLARLLDQASNLERWADGDSVAGLIASDALDQAVGLLEDPVEVLLRDIRWLRRQLPTTSSDWAIGMRDGT